MESFSQTEPLEDGRPYLGPAAKVTPEDVFFPPSVPDCDVSFVVMLVRENGRLLVCHHQGRGEWELPGGRRERGETPFEAAARELWEETGALEFELAFLGWYGVRGPEGQTFGAAYSGVVSSRGDLPPYEIASVCPVDQVPEGGCAYPEIQPAILEHFAGRF